jgi:transketolase
LPEDRKPAVLHPAPVEHKTYGKGEMVATREAYGHAITSLGAELGRVVVLDAEVGNSTGADTFQNRFPERFFEMFIAEQNMVGVALGLSLRGKIPFVSTFAAFLMRACDQIRMARISNGRLTLCGSHAGVSIGEDGPSQMGLEDLAFFRTILDCAVLYPADAVSTSKLVFESARREGISYLRTTRGKTPVLYDQTEAFPIGGSKVLRESPDDRLTIVAAGITLHEALAAADRLAGDGIHVRVIDLYSIKPIDAGTLKRSAEETGIILTVEDHFAEGGIGEAVMSAIADSPCPVHRLAVTKKPRSGKPEELLDFEGISRKAIEEKVRKLIKPGILKETR